MRDKRGKKMPTTYTHDLFGKEVYRKMPKEMRRLVKAHGETYRIGLHGPDILFYYGFGKNRVNQTGVRLHGEPAAPFFERGALLAREDDALLAYLLGFVCHFMLDSICHPYVNGTAAREVGHGEIEKELDRRLMIRTGRDPYRYYPAACCIRPSLENARVIQKVFPEVTVCQVEKALRSMIFITNTMVYDDNGRKQKVILPFLRLIGAYDKVGGSYMRAACDPCCAPHLEALEGLFSQAVEETPAMLEAFWETVREGTSLPERFDRDYK